MLNILSHRPLAQAFLFSGSSAVTRRSTTLAAAGSFYDIVEKDASGKDITFSKFKGKVVYGVNVASKCGYVSNCGKNLVVVVVGSFSFFPLQNLLLLFLHMFSRIFS